MSSNVASTVIGGTSYYYQTSGAADAIVQGPGGSLQFTVHPGDVWSLDPTTVNRSEIASGTQIANGTPVHVAYQMAIQSGAVDPDPSSWAVLGQFHQNDSPNTPHNSPPFSVSIVAGKMQIAIGYSDAVSKDTSRVIWTDPKPVVQGATYAMDIKATFDPNGNGHLTVSRNGVTLVDYAGPLGYTSQSSVYWKEGIYRGASTTTMVASYSNLSVATDAAASSARALAAPASMDGFQLSSTTTDHDAGTGTVSGSIVRYVSTDASQTFEKRFDGSGTLIYQQQKGLDGSQTTITYGSDGALQQSVAVHADGSSDIAQYGLTNQAYVSLLTHKGSQGLVTWQQEGFANGCKITAECGGATDTFKTKTTFFDASGVKTCASFLNLDGSSAVYSYAAGGGMTQAILTAKDGTQATTTYASNGVIQQSKIASNGGDKAYTSYDAAGIKTSTFYSHADGSSETDSYASSGALIQAIIIAKDGTQTSTTYASNGVIQQSKVASVGGDKAYTSYTAAGIKTGTFLSHADGSSETDSFAANGALTQAIIMAEDGTQTTNTYAGNGVIQQSKVVYSGGEKDYTAYNAAGVKTNTFFGHADGSSETDIFAANGVANQKIFTAKDGTQTTNNYAGNGAIQLSKVIHTDGSRDYTNYDAAGTKTSTYYGHLDGSSETDVFAGTGAMTQKIVSAKDGTQTTQSYGLTGSLDEMKMINADGSRLYLDYNVGGHLSIMTKVNAAGATTAVQQIEKDGSATGKAFAAGVTLVSQGGNDAFTSYHNDTFVFHQGFGNDTVTGFNGAGASRDVLQIDKSVVADFSHLTMTQSGANTLITASPHDSITLKGVNVSALTASNFTFV